MVKRFLLFGIITLSLGAQALLLTGCESDFDKKVRASVSDGKITASEWESLSQKAANDKRFLGEDGQFDPSLLRDYINEYAATKLRGIGEVAYDVPQSVFMGSHQLADNTPITVKFYLERSGSMTSYDTKEGKGDFKSTIVKMLNSLPQATSPEEELLYIVNDAVYPVDMSFKDFIISKDIFAETQGIGDARYTDFTCIFDSLLNRTKPNELGIFVSDLIYSTKDMVDTNPQKILNEAKDLTTTIFRNHKGLNVAVLKFNADYNGNYYSYNSPTEGKPYYGSRPYYILLVGEPGVMDRIFTKPEYSEFRNFKNLPGFEDYYCFTNHELKLNYSIILSHEKNRGRMKPARTGTDYVRSLTKFDTDKDGVRTMAIGVDLSNVIAPEEYILDPKNYELESLSGFEISKIAPISPAEAQDSNIKKYIQNPTHIFVLSSSDPSARDNISLKLLNVLPQWVENSSADDDSNVNAPDFSNTTFAFNELMQGIYYSYFKTVDHPAYFTLTIDIESK